MTQLLEFFIFFFFFNDTATTEIYTLSLHDALPTSPASVWASMRAKTAGVPSRSRLTPVGSANCLPRAPNMYCQSSELRETVLTVTARRNPTVRFAVPYRSRH